MVGTDPRPIRVISRRRTPGQDPDRPVNGSLPKVKCKTRKKMGFDVSSSRVRLGEELSHRLLQPRALQVARDEDDAGPAIRPAPAWQRRRRMEQMLNAMDRDRRIRAGDV